MEDNILNILNEYEDAMSWRAVKENYGIEKPDDIEKLLKQTRKDIIQYVVKRLQDPIHCVNADIQIQLLAANYEEQH